MYLIIDKFKYKSLLDNILSDHSKFKKETRCENTIIQSIKRKLNVEITAINAERNPHGFKNLEGNYKAGYIYGNLKTHKSLTDPPMRPIISQIPSPTYSIAKKIDKIISPYMPAKYMLKSTAEFLEILSQHKPQGIMSSLDVESLYTNVPVRDTIDIVLRNVYNHDSLPP